MEVFVCWDGDKIGRRVGRAVLSDDVGEVRRVDQAINAGNELMRAFALNVGGNVIEIGGDEGRICIDASRLGEVPALTSRYSETVGASLSVGIGMKMSESAKALVIAKLRGGDQIVVWDDSLQPEYDEVANAPKAEKEKIADEYLAKADENEDQSGAAATTHSGELAQNTVGKNHGVHAGFSTQHEPGFTDRKPGGDDAAPGGPPDPETTHAGDDFEAQLHDAANDQASKDDDDKKKAGDNAADIKQKVGEALARVRQQLPILATLQQTSPDAYQSILGLVQGVILLGKEVMDKNPPPQDKLPEHAENALSKAIPKEPGKLLSQKLQPGRTPWHAPGTEAPPAPKELVSHTDFSHLLPKEAAQSGMKLVVEHTKRYPEPPSGFGGETIRSKLFHPSGEEVGYVTAHVLAPRASRNKKVPAIEPHSELKDQYHGKGLGSALYEAAYSHALQNGIKRVEGGVHSEDAHRLHKRLSEKHGFAYKSRKQNVKEFPYVSYGYNIKAESEMDAEPVFNDRELFGPGKGMTFVRDVELNKDEKLPTEVHHNLPVGATQNGKMKVRHADGSQSWKQMEAGMIQAQEPGAPLFGANSHPTSSREPGSR
jgi:GNAT superfamily N-acetyltransferase